MTLSNNLCSASVQSKRRPSGYSLEPRLTGHGPMGVLAHPPLRSRDSGSGWGDGFPRCDQPGDLRGAPASPREFQWPKPDYVLPLVSGRGERTADRPPEGDGRKGESLHRSTEESKGFAEWLSGISKHGPQRHQGPPAVPQRNASGFDSLGQLSQRESRGIRTSGGNPEAEHCIESPREARIPPGSSGRKRGMNLRLGSQGCPSPAAP